MSLVVYTGTFLFAAIFAEIAFKMLGLLLSTLGIVGQEIQILWQFSYKVNYFFHLDSEVSGVIMCIVSRFSPNIDSTLVHVEPEDMNSAIFLNLSDLRIY